MKKRSKDISSSSHTEIYSSSAKAEKAKKKKKQRSKPKRILIALGKIIVSLFLIGVITGCIVITALTVYVMKATETPTDLVLTKEAIQTTGITTVLAEDPNNVGEYIEVARLSDGVKRIWADIQDCPEDLQNAFIAIEDKRFRDHEGVDFKRTFAAFANMFLHFWDSEQGGSTITQQLVKNLTNDDSHSGARKIREIFRAMSLERTYSKQQILQAYLNVVAVGSNCEGVATAAKLYYDKEVQDLTLSECATIAAIPKAPSNYNPIDNPEANLERRNLVLKNMLEQGYITQEQHDEAVNTPLNLNPGVVSGNVDGKEYQSYFVDATIQEVAADLNKKQGRSGNEELNESDIKAGGYTIYTTMDANAQNILEEAYQNSETFSSSRDVIAENEESKRQAEETKDTENPVEYNPYQSSAVIYDLNGGMKAIVGGIGEKTYLRPTSSLRSPGSSIKPLTIYGPAIEENLIHYSSLVEDTPFSIISGGEPWEPKNYNANSYEGNITIQHALEKSLNIPAARIGQLLTPEKSFKYLTEKLQFTDLDEANDANPAPMALGSFSEGVHLNQLTNAYQAFANGGTVTESHTYTRVEDSNGEVILSEEDFTTTQAFSSETSSIMNRLLRQVVVGSQGTGKAASLDSMGIEVVGKTGTTNDDKDYTFVGVTPYYIMGVWTGFDIQKDMMADQRQNGSLRKPAEIFNRVMSSVLSGRDEASFTLNSNVIEADYCTESGQLATSNCPSTKHGYYKSDNIPSSCTTHP